MLKRAAVNLHAQTTGQGHAALSVAIYQEKCVQDCIAKLLQAKKEAANSWLKWAKFEEQNVPVRELFMKLAELDYLWIRTYRDYFKQYDEYRGYFKQILQGDKAVDECRKKVLDFNPKIEKLQKQVTKIDKSKEKKMEELHLEYGKLVSLQQKAERDLEIKKENNDLYKYKTVRNAVKEVNDAETKLHERGYEISQTQRLLLDFYTATTYGCITQQIMEVAKSNGTQLLDELETKLNFDDGENLSPIMQQQQSLEEPLDPEDIAEYCPIPEMDSPIETTATRPLPPLPPGEQDSPSAPLDPSYRPSPTNPYYGLQQALHSPAQAYTDLNQHTQANGKRVAPEPPLMTSAGAPVAAARKAAAIPRRPSQNAEPRSEEMQYLQVIDSHDMKRNTVYESGERNSYLRLGDLYSHKQHSQPDTSQTDEYAIYDSVGEDDVHMRLGDVTRKDNDSSVYEL